MSLAAYIISYGLEDAQVTGVSSESLVIARELQVSRNHSHEPAYQQVKALRQISPIRARNELLANVELAIKNLPSSAMRTQANSIISIFRKAASAYGVNNQPPLSASIATDGSLLVEWIFSDKRLGFNVEPNQDESGWYFVSSETAGGYCESGLLSTLDIKQLMARILAKQISL